MLWLLVTILRQRNASVGHAFSFKKFVDVAHAGNVNSWDPYIVTACNILLFTSNQSNTVTKEKSERPVYSFSE